MSQVDGGEELAVEAAPEGTALSGTGLSGTGLSGTIGTTGQGGRSGGGWSRTSSALTERAQDLVSSLVAACLIVLAAAILVAAVVDLFTSSHRQGLTTAASDFLDKVLLVLILVEIVHTVVLSLRAHALAAQPFLVVGLVAVIRKILFALGSQHRLSDSTLGIYIGMVAVFVASLVAIEMLGHRRRGRGRPAAEDATADR